MPGAARRVYSGQKEGSSKEISCQPPRIQIWMEYSAPKDGLQGAVLEEKGGPRGGKSAFLQGEADFFAVNKGEGAFAANLPWVPLPLRKEPGRNQEQKEEKSGKPFFHSSSLCQQRGEKVCHFSFCFFFFSCEKKKKWGCRGRSPCYTWISSIFLLSAKRFSSSLKR